MSPEARHRKAILSKVKTGELSAAEALELLVATANPAVESAVKPSAEGSEAVSAAPAPPPSLRERLAAHLKEIVAAEAQIPASRIGLEEPLERYGFDSVMALNVVRRLEEDFGKLSPTLLFEYQSVDALAGHLIGEHQAAANRLLGGGPGAPAAGSAAAPAAPPEQRATPAPSSVPRPRPHGGVEAGEEAVAIVGLSCRFPQAEDLEAFWENLKAGKDSITEIPRERWDHRGWFDPEPGKAGKSYSKWGGFVADADAFDAAFFHISPREAERMDPQERLFLEEVWHALEDAAMPRRRLAGRAVGVYVGVMYSQYQLLAAEEAVRGNPLYLGSSYASIANRVSYAFDFQGPSMAIDTMCSSSLTAIHLACDALRRGDIEVAVAGGVNLTLHPAKHVDLSQGRYASTDGRCRSFGAGGDGYVPGEGVGVAVLKPLAAARADGDRIHAVVRGSALNHGGKTNGYSVPNPGAQGRVIAEAFSRSGVEPRQVSYLEAHGTGTSLGDPIEIRGLVNAFAARTSDTGFCAIGSVKSNIGHLESAAGIAGLAKVVLQMRHGMLVPSLHAETLNPHIEFESTPFRVQRSLAAWRPPDISDAEGRRVPRIAGISSFGAGGANAHLLVEEPAAEAPAALPAAVEAGPHLILLSAASGERLRVWARTLAGFLARPAHGAIPDGRLLARLAFTLQVGREPLEERLALWVTGRDELVGKLRAFAGGDTDGVLTGRVEESKGELEVLLGGSSGTSFFESLLGARDFERLARLWLRGADIPWQELAAQPWPRKMALPGYPFARVRHWPAVSEGASPAVSGTAAALHPLVGRNVSTLDEQCFATVFDGSEPVLAHHQVAGRSLLPAAALLEMARAAAALSGLDGEVRLAGTVWESPVAAEPGRRCELSVSLVPRGSGPDDGVDYTVWSVAESGGRTVHARGRLLELRRSSGEAAERLDLPALEAACGEVLDGELCYRIFARRGLDYGPAFQSLERLAHGDGQALGWLRLPAAADEGSEAFLLPPALLDGAFQTLLAFDREPAAGELQVPFAVDELEVLARLPQVCRVHTVARAAADGVPRSFDLTLAAEDGRVVARIRGLMVRPFSAPRSAVSPATVLLRPVWAAAEPPASPAAGRQSVRRVLLFEGGGVEGELLAEALLAGLRRCAGGGRAAVQRVRPGEEVAEVGQGVWEIRPGSVEDHRRLVERVWAPETRPDAVVHAWSRPAPAEPASAEVLERGFYSMLSFTRALMELVPGEPVRLVSVWPAAAGSPPAAWAALGAFHRTVAAENPSFVFTSLETAAVTNGGAVWDEGSVGSLLDELERAARGGEEVRWEGGEHRLRTLEELPAQKAEGAAAELQSGSVVLLTGGLGGVGRIFARYLAARRRARLVLAGRSPLDAAGEAFLAELERAGGQAIHVEADCSRQEGAERMVAAALEAYGRLDGVLHLAGALRDGLVLKKRREDAEAVLAAKVWGAHHLDRATAGMDLELFALCSSASSVMGISGQSDYAFANAFLDRFSVWREEERRRGRRSGRTISIDWPLWHGGGMDVDDRAKAWIEEHLGWLPLPAEEGLRVFEAALAAEDPQWAVFYGHREKILQSLGVAGEPGFEAHAAARAAAKPKTPEVPDPGPGRAPRRGGGTVEKALVADLARRVAAELKLPAEDLDPRRRFEHLGIESVMVMNLTRDLEEIFGELPKTLFFEHQNLLDLAAYFVDHHGERVAERFGSAEPAPEAASPSASSAVPSPARSYRIPPARREGRGETAVPDAADRGLREPAEPVAVIGLAGRYPRAGNLETFWSNLRRGLDCITEVPGERWDHSRYFDPSGSRPASTVSKWGGFLDGADEFDPRFFNISPREARLMDPQERLFLETAWHTLEDAGTTRAGLGGQRVGVFVGVMYGHYQLYGTDEALQARGFVPSSVAATVANRVSFAFDLHGPSLSLDTMCSSSLTALHLACASLRLGDCDAALAGGVNATVHPNKYLQLSQSNFVSSDGRCRSFGEGGDGYVPGEGVGAVLLKPLSRALADGDHIYAVVRGSAVNHGGRSNGFSVPTPVAQGEVIRRALERSGVDPREIDYIEAHGTGTSLGDPIEIEGLTRAFQGGSLPAGSIPIGSVKSNIGHLESAAGIAGMTKVLLQLRHGELVPSIHSERLNPNIRFADTPFRVQRTLEPWPRPTGGGGERPRRAAVSSFGAGGSNAHVVLEEHIPAARAPEVPSRQLVVLSAKSEEQLRTYAAALAERVDPAAAARDARGEAAAGERERLAELSAAAAEIVGVDAREIEADEDLEAYGFDPHAFEELAERVHRRWGAALAPTALAEGRTLRAVLARLADAAGEPLGDRPTGGAPGVPAAAGEPLRLEDVAYTTQVGREALVHRLAVVAADLGELGAGLRRFAAGEAAAGVHHGRAAGPGPWERLFEVRESDAPPRTLADAPDPETLAALWTSGADIDWSALPREGRPRRVPLPVYPFARQRYWLLERETEGAAAEVSLPQAPSAEAGPGEPAVGEVAAVEPAAPAQGPAEPEAAAGAAVPEAPGWERARSVIVGAMAAVLEIDPSEFDLDLPHSELGVDSVLAVEIVDRINQTLGTELKPTDFFNYSTLRKLTAHVAGHQAGETPRERGEHRAAATARPPLEGKGQGGESRETAAAGENGAEAEDGDQRLLELLARLERGEISAQEADRLLGPASS